MHHTHILGFKEKSQSCVIYMLLDHCQWLRSGITKLNAGAGGGRIVTASLQR